MVPPATYGRVCTSCWETVPQDGRVQRMQCQAMQKNVKTGENFQPCSRRYLYSTLPRQGIRPAGVKRCDQAVVGQFDDVGWRDWSRAW